MERIVTFSLNYDKNNDIFMVSCDNEALKKLYDFLAKLVYDEYKSNEWKYSEDDFVSFRHDYSEIVDNYYDHILMSIVTIGNGIDRFNIFIEPVFQCIPMMIWAYIWSQKTTNSNTRVEEIMLKIQTQTNTQKNVKIN